MTQILEKIDGVLCFDGAPIPELASKYDTPLYVISERRIRENYRRVRQALAKEYDSVRIYYSAKANTSLCVLRILENEGAYLDAVSLGEIFLAKAAGFSPGRILFTGTSVRDDELRHILKSKVTINIDSVSQLDRLLKAAVPERLSFRINPEFGAGHHEHCITAGRAAKFGLWEDDVPTVYSKAKEAGVKLFGIHMHIGSGIMSAEAYLIATQKLLEVAKRVHDETGIEFEFIDIGGGMGIPYKLGEEAFDLNRFAHGICDLYKQRTREYGLGQSILCVEPGRYIVGDACILVTRVNTVKKTPYKKFAGVDAGFNTLMRPVMYGAYHHILVAKEGTGEEETYDVAGPICESGDLLAKDRRLLRVEEGDLLVILNTGAYGYSMSSQYNSRPRAAEVLVQDGRHALIRKRETMRDLRKGQMLAEWLR